MTPNPHQPIPPVGERPRHGTVSFGHHAPGLAFVEMRGEHDLSTASALTRALEDAAAHSNVLVDLSECTFIDSTVLKTLIRTAINVQARDEQLVAVIPPELAQLSRIATLTHLAEIIPLHATRAAAIASLEHFIRAQPHP
jgi:anti-sigma B factor antagonist